MTRSLWCTLKTYLKMTAESSTFSHLSVVMTTAGITQVIGENTMTSSSNSMEIYFRCIFVVMGIIGTATNGIILYALVASKQHKKLALIVNQNALDFFTSFVLVVTYSVKLWNLPLNGYAGYWLCTFVISDAILWWGIIGSVINLAAITVERYLKVVHSTWSKTNLCNWMIYSTVAFSWISSLVISTAVVFSTTMVFDGECYPYAIWANQAAQIFEIVCVFVSFYGIILFIFTFCYWRIVIVIRRQGKVMANHADVGPSTAEIKTQKMQSSVIKTMIFVSALYVIFWMPNYIYSLYLELNPDYSAASINYSYIFAFLYTCINPFVYATKFDPVKKVLLRLIFCKMNFGNISVAPSTGTGAQ